MSTTTNMGITKWAGSDYFSYAELAANWDKVDAHDHTSGKGLQIPTAGIANSAITSAKIADGTIVDADINSSAAIDGSKIAAASIPLTKLGSTWINVKTVGARFNVASPSTDYTFLPNELFPTLTGSAAFSALSLFYLDPADYAVGQMRLRGMFSNVSGATRLGNSALVHLYSVTDATGAGASSISSFQIGSVTSDANKIVTGTAFSLIPSAKAHYIYCTFPQAGLGGATDISVKISLQWNPSL